VKAHYILKPIICKQGLRF